MLLFATATVSLFTHLVSTFCPQTDQDEKEIPLPNVKSAVLSKVIEYLKYHCNNPPKEIEKPLKSAHMTEVAGPWDAEFVEVDQELLFELILVGFLLRPSFHFFLYLHFHRLFFLFPASLRMSNHVLAFPTTRLPTTWISSRFWTSPVPRLRL